MRNKMSKFTDVERKALVQLSEIIPWCSGQIVNGRCIACGAKCTNNNSAQIAHELERSKLLVQVVFG